MFKKDNDIKKMLLKDYRGTLKKLLEFEEENGAYFVNDLTVDEVLEQFFNDDDSNITIFDLNKYIG